MDPRHNPLAQVERRVRDAEERVARQRALLEEMERNHRLMEAEFARVALTNFETSLELMRDLLRAQRRRHGLEP